MLADLLKIAFPKNCVSCKNTLLNGENQICIVCSIGIHHFSEEISKNNSMSQPLEPNIIEKIGALWEFDKKGKVQEILYELKYNGNKSLGNHLGELIGIKLRSTEIFFEEIIPVPLHKKKLKKRGYNQAEILGKGVSEITGVPINNLLIRNRNTETQTKKSKQERIANIKNAFSVNPKIKKMPGHVLLVDDVFTTGVTIQECISTLKRENVDVKISVFCLAFSRI